MRGGRCRAPQLLQPQLGHLEMDARRPEQRLPPDTRLRRGRASSQPRDVSKHGANSRAPNFELKTAQKSPDELHLSAKASKKTHTNTHQLFTLRGRATLPCRQLVWSLFRVSSYVNGSRLNRDAQAEKSLGDPPLKLRCSPLRRTFIRTCRRGRRPCLCPRSEFSW